MLYSLFFSIGDTLKCGCCVFKKCNLMDDKSLLLDYIISCGKLLRFPCCNIYSSSDRPNMVEFN